MAHTLSRKQSPAVVTVSRATPFAALPEWLSVAEVGRFLGLSKSSAYSTIHRLPRKKFGRHYRISKFHFQPVRGSR